MKASEFFLVMVKVVRIIPANSNLQQTSQAGLIPFCSKRNWAQVPETPQKTAAAKAMVKPLIVLWETKPADKEGEIIKMAESQIYRMKK